MVKPIGTLAAYIGGKRNLRNVLCPLIDETAHDNYVEVFGGMAGVLFGRRGKAKGETINDISSEIANLFRIVQRHEAYFLDMMKYPITSREEFYRLRKQDPATLTDLERARRFLLLQTFCFGGRVKSPTYGIDPNYKNRSSTRRASELHGRIKAAAERLIDVVIECLPYQDCIEKYDLPNTLFYLDPPYYGCENDYGKHIFSREDFDTLAAQLAGIEGKFILSINDTPETRDIFKGFYTKEVALPYTICSGDATEAKELIISNYDLNPPTLFSVV